MDAERPEDRNDQTEWPIRVRGRFIDAMAFGALVKKHGRADGTIDARPKDARVTIIQR
jgi:hypothetical protein